jgi:uncharacterized integral membrane protein
MATPPDSAARADKAGGRGARFWGAVAAATLALVFILQNTDETRVKFLFAEAELPLFFALLITTLLGVIIGWLAPRVRRGRRAPGRSDE